MLLQRKCVCFTGGGIAFCLLFVIDKLVLCLSQRNWWRTFLNSVVRFLVVSAIVTTFLTLAILVGRSFRSREYCDPGAFYLALFVLIMSVTETALVAVLYLCQGLRREHQHSLGGDLQEAS